MNPSFPEPRRPIFGIIALVLLASLFVIPVAGFFLTSSAIDETPRDGQNFGLLILAVVGFLAVVIAMGIAGFGAALAGGIAVARGERYSWFGWLGLILGGLLFVAIAGTALAIAVSG